MSDTDGYYIYEAVVDGTQRCFAALLPHDTGFASGLPSEAIMGEFTHGPEVLTPEAFQQNPQFIQFMAYAIGKHCSQCPGLVAEAARQLDGFVYVLDKRTPTPDDGVPPEDIIGGVEIEKGQVIRFHGSPNYRILTADGFMQLDDWLRERMIEELVAIASADGDPQREQAG